MCKNHWVSWIVPIIKSGVTIMLGTWKEQGTVFQGRPHLTPFHPSFSPSLLPSPTDSQRGKLWGPSSSNLDAPSLIYPCSHSSKGDMVGPNRPADHTALGRTTAPNSFHWGLLRRGFSFLKDKQKLFTQVRNAELSGQRFPTNIFASRRKFPTLKSLSQQPSRDHSGGGLWRLKDLCKAVVTVHPQVTGVKIRKPRRGWP